MKCDEIQPQCTVCARDNLSCEGYTKCLFFDLDQSKARSSTRFRRPLLTDGEREDLSTWLTSTIEPNQVLPVLLQIEQQCLSGDPNTSIGVHFGPFGALRFRQEQTALSVNSPTNSNEDFAITDGLDMLDHNDSSVLETFSWEQTQDRSGTSPQLWDLTADDLVPPLAEELPTSTVTMNDHHDKSGASMDTLPSTCLSPRALQQISIQSTQTYVDWLAPTNIDSSIEFGNSVHSNVEHMGVLLRHYASTIITSFSPIRHTKTPWHVLFLPHARSGIAALALGDPVDHASLSTLYGILAISAFSLGILIVAQPLLVQARTYESQARQQTDLMLKTAYRTPKVSKYKSILMGLITMAKVSIAFGQRTQAEHYLLEAEKFIRLKGLNRRKSRKVRLLHHCYVYVRIFHESTFGRVADFEHRKRIRKAIESDVSSPHGRDGLSFRHMGWNDLDKEMLSTRSKEDHENDLHLGIPSLHHASLYSEISGIPESWFYIFSQVIRLGNEKDAAGDDEESSVLTMNDFMRYSNAIEKWINELSRWTKTRGLLEAYQGQHDPSILHSVFDVMVCALSIYFYRRIYNVHASLLQQKVTMIRDYLVESLTSEDGIVFGSVAFIWPAFIAACEAEDDGVRVTFSDWFSQCASRSGLPCFSENLQMIERVWQAKDEAHGTGVSWLDIMKREIVGTS